MCSITNSLPFAYSVRLKPGRYPTRPRFGFNFNEAQVWLVDIIGFDIGIIQDSAGNRKFVSPLSKKLIICPTRKRPIREFVDTEGAASQTRLKISCEFAA